MEKTLLNKINLSYNSRNYHYDHLLEINHFKETALMAALNNNAKIKFTNQELDYLIKHSNLFAIDLYGRTSLMLAILYNRSQNLNLTEQQWQYLIENSNLKQTDRNNFNTLMYVCNFNKDQNINLNHQLITYLIENSDLSQVNNYGMNNLMFALNLNKDQNLNLTHEQFDYLIKNSDLSIRNENGWNALLMALFFEADEKLKLKQNQWQYLIENSDLLVQGKDCQLSVLGLIASKKTPFVELIFDKVLSDKKFNLNNYKKDIYYQQIKETINRLKLRKQINDLLPATSSPSKIKL